MSSARMKTMLGRAGGSAAVALVPRHTTSTTTAANAAFIEPAVTRGP